MSKKQKIVSIFAILFFLSACSNTSVPDSPAEYAQVKGKCIPPITSFAFPANTHHTEFNERQILPSAPWQIEIPLPEVTVGELLFDYVSFARTKDGYNEVWVKRILNVENGNSEKVPRIQFLIYRTDIRQWKLIPEEFNDSSAKSGLIYLAKNGTIWAELGFSDISYFVRYNEKTEQFEILEGSENVTSYGNRLLDDNGIFWILDSRNDGIYSFDTNSLEFKPHLNMPNLETGSALYSTMAALAPDGSIYFLNITGENQTQLLHYIPQTGQLENVPGLTYLEDVAYYLFVDHTGQVWLGDLGWMEVDGTWNRIVRSPIFITDKAESANQYIWARPSILLESSDERLWLHSENGLAWLDPLQGEWCWFTTEQSNIVEDQDGSLWMIADNKLYTLDLEQ